MLSCRLRGWILPRGIFRLDHAENRANHQDDETPRGRLSEQHIAALLRLPYRCSGDTIRATVPCTTVRPTSDDAR